MKRVTSILVVCIAVVSMGFSQGIERQVIGSAGTSAEAGGIEISYTVGESVISTEVVSGSFTLTQGFQQAEGEQMPTGIEKRRPRNRHRLSTVSESGAGRIESLAYLIPRNERIHLHDGCCRPDGGECS